MADLPLNEQVWRDYEKGLTFNNALELDETVRRNESFFIGNQWEGVENNGLPTPIFNFLKRVTLFQVASITTDNIKMQASPLSAAGNTSSVQALTDIVNREFESLFEHNKVGALLQEYMRNAAVDGDGCMYSYWDADAETGQVAKGRITTEIIENTRVFFGDPNDRRVQRQPHIIISSREMVESAQKRAKRFGGTGADSIAPDSDDASPARTQITGDKVTVLLKLWRDDETGTIHGCETTRTAVIRKEWDLGLRLYPVTWLNWDYIQDSYHGQAMITGLIPNQVFVNKLYAMSQISLMTMAYPKIVYDKTRITKWDNRVGAAVGINGGGVENIAKVIEPARMDPQVSQFIDGAINHTQTFLGATSAAMGDTRPDNTSAIIALQRAAAIPSEITKQNLYQSIEDLGRIYIDFMGVNYGQRLVEQETAQGVVAVPFDFSVLMQVPMSLKLDVGASAYWSEIASMQTLDNLLMQGKIDVTDYLERVPDGYIAKKQELIEKIRQTQAVMMQQQGMPGGGGTDAPLVDMGVPPEIPTGGGYSALQRAINKTGEVAG